MTIKYDTVIRERSHILTRYYTLTERGRKMYHGHQDVKMNTIVYRGFYKHRVVIGFFLEKGSGPLRF